MGFTSPFGNLKGFTTSRPPLVIFTLCLTAFALTTLSLAYFIRHSERIPNADVRVDWNRFLKHLSSFDLCVLPDAAGNSSRSVDEEQSDVFGNVSIAVTASLSLVQQLSSLPHNITVTGFLPLGAWSHMCKTESLAAEGTVLNVSLVLPQNLSQADDVCVTFVGPRSVLPVVSAQPACTPLLTPQQGFTGRLMGQSRDSEVLGEREDDDWCKGGTVMRMAYRSNPELTVVLTGLWENMNCAYVGFIADALYLSLPLIPQWLEWDVDKLDIFHYMWTWSERSLINLHLMHTSYFLFVMAMTLVCYALIKGKPKQKAVLVDKVPLDP